jgi:hypothetical protein
MMRFVALLVAVPQSRLIGLGMFRPSLAHLYPLSTLPV